jgi:hypothetical protein
MSFDSYNCPLKIQESIKAPTFKMGVHLGVWGSFPHTFLHSWASLLARTFINPCFGCKPKARVVTKNQGVTFLVVPSKDGLAQGQEGEVPYKGRSLQNTNKNIEIKEL